MMKISLEKADGWTGEHLDVGQPANDLGLLLSMNWLIDFISITKPVYLINTAKCYSPKFSYQTNQNNV